MNASGFLALLREIYGPGLPDVSRIQRRGLLAVKIAQHFALRVDFLRPEVCQRLSTLFRATETLPPEDVERLLGAATGPGWSGQVGGLDPKPLASASIGQVHAARLADGSDVIVKLVKQDFGAQFRRDVASLRRLLTVTVTVYPKLRKVFDPMGVLDFIEDYTQRELDLRNEIAGARELQAIAAQYRGRYDLSRLRLPRFYPDLSGQDLLVAERIPGRTFDELLQEGLLAWDDLLALFRIHGFYLFGIGIFHGDIHPGNIILTPAGEIALIDTGAVSRVGDRIRRGLFRFFLALADYDYGTCALRLNEMAEKGIAGARLAAFERDLVALYADFRGSQVGTLSLTRRMMDTIKLAVHAGMEFERGMFAIIKSLMYLDGMVLRCRPEAVLMEEMRPALQAFQKAVPV